MRAQVPPDSVAEPFLAEEPFEHRQHAAALLIGDGVELVPDVLDVVERLPHRPRACERVLLHRLIDQRQEGVPGAVRRLPFIDGAIAHPGGEGLVEPGIRPPAQGDEIAEPLVRHLVRHDACDRSAGLLGADARMEQ